MSGHFKSTETDRHPCLLMSLFVTPGLKYRDGQAEKDWDDWAGRGPGSCEVRVKVFEIVPGSAFHDLEPRL